VKSFYSNNLDYILNLGNLKMYILIFIADLIHLPLFIFGVSSIRLSWYNVWNRKWVKITTPQQLKSQVHLQQL